MSTHEPVSSSSSAERELRAPRAEVYKITLADGALIQLTRYQGGDKGPVLLVHCIGVSSNMYSLTSVPTNLLEYLVAAGFDVWLLDFRFSIALVDAQKPANFDMVAKLDYPAAVAKVLQVTGKENLQVVAHGIGSQTFCMAMLSGLQGVRSAVCSQVAVHLHAPLLSRFKASLHLTSVMRSIGMSTLTTSPIHTNFADRLLDASLRFHPIKAGERCSSKVCRRITGFYGALYKHEQLNEQTHAALGSLFGIFNLMAFQHLTTNLNKGHLVAADGTDCYLPALRRLAIPITFIHGLDNDCLLPLSTQETFAALCKLNGESLYQWHGIKGYGHVDCIIGHQAVTDVYPKILAHLETK